MKIGILGGSFNPVHFGHLIMAQDALELFELDRLLLMPAADPPHKPSEELEDAAHRLEMLELALEDETRFEVSDIEIRRGGTSYTIDTIRQVRADNPDASIFFIIGSDTLPELHTWKAIPELLERCTIVTFARPGFDAEAITPDALHLEPPWPERLRENIVSGHPVQISSSDIRMRVAEGMGIRYLVPREVEMYIAEHGLYRC